jgi:hypothetical protein
MAKRKQTKQSKPELTDLQRDQLAKYARVGNNADSETTIFKNDIGWTFRKYPEAIKFLSGEWERDLVNDIKARKYFPQAFDQSRPDFIAFKADALRSLRVVAMNFGSKKKADRYYFDVWVNDVSLHTTWNVQQSIDAYKIKLAGDKPTRAKRKDAAKCELCEMVNKLLALWTDEYLMQDPNMNIFGMRTLIKDAMKAGGDE